MYYLFRKFRLGSPISFSLENFAEVHIIYQRQFPSALHSPDWQNISLVQDDPLSRHSAQQAKGQATLALSPSLFSQLHLLSGFRATKSHVWATFILPAQVSSLIHSSWGIVGEATGDATGAEKGELEVGGGATGDATGEDVQSESQASGQAVSAFTPPLSSHLHLLSGFLAT